MLTGQLIFRDSGQPSPRDGCKLMMVCGVIAVPLDFPLKGEHQYVISGSSKNLFVHLDTGINLTEQIQGLTLNQIITSPLWRV